MAESDERQEIGILSDVHAEDERLSRSLFYMKGLGIREFLFAGDVVDGRGDAEVCISMLRGVGAISVLGNHDQWCLEENNGWLFDATPLASLSEEAVAFLKAMPATQSLELCGERILLCHGVGADNMCNLKSHDTGYALQSNTRLNEVLGQGYDMMIHGHTHLRTARRLGKMIVINPGTLSDRRAGIPSFATLHVHDWIVRFYELHDNGLDIDIELAEEIDLTELPNEY